GLPTRRPLVFDLRPLQVELPVDVVVLVVALLAHPLVQRQDALGLGLVGLVGRGLPGVEQLPPLRVVLVLHVPAAGAVAALTAHLLQVRRLLLVGEAALVGEAGDVADDALAVVLPQRRPLRVHQRLVGVGVARILPDLVGVLVAVLARLRADVGRARPGHRPLVRVVALHVLRQVVAVLQLPGVLLHHRHDRPPVFLPLPPP